MYIFHFNGGNGVDYIIIAPDMKNAMEGLRKIGVQHPERMDCFSSAPVESNEIVSIRATKYQGFYMTTTRAIKQ